jgi:two-component system cell cycle response regulator DivK
MPVLQGKKVLVVEDTVENMRLFTVLLRMAGAEVVEACDGVSGVETAKRELPDLILMDIHMPGVDGLEATRRIRADALTANIPVVAVTALVMPRDIEEIEHVGCNGYLAKPIEPMLFAQQLAAHLTPVAESTSAS